MTNFDDPSHSLANMTGQFLDFLLGDR